MRDATIKFTDISGLLYPKSIAVIGASDRVGNLGGDTIERLQRFGFPGTIWAVNPGGGMARGLHCCRSVRELPEAPESVILAMPGAAVLDTISECAAIGTRNGVAYAGGFAEIGGQGVELQRRLTALCRELDFKLCGPNCVGILNAETPVTSTFTSGLHDLTSLRSGGVSIVTQSGAIGVTIFFTMQKRGFGGRHLISGGNEAVVTLSDYIYGLACDDGTKVIAVYLEGVDNGAKLARALQEARDRDKPVVLIKSGATCASARAARAHTNANVGDDHVLDAILEEMDVIRVRSVQEMINVCMMLSGISLKKVPAGRGVGIVTFGGGNGVLAADQCSARGLTVPQLDENCVENLRPLLIPVASAANPMDLTPTTAARLESLHKLPAALDVMASQSDIHSLIVIVGAMAAREREISQVFIDYSSSCTKPLCVTWPSPPAGTVERFAEHGIVCFEEPDQGLHALDRLATYGAARHRRRHLAEEPAHPAFDWSAHAAMNAAGTLDDQCRLILKESGLLTAPHGFAQTEADALRIAGEIGWPIALRCICPIATQSAAMELTISDLHTPQELGSAFRELQSWAGKNHERAHSISVTRANTSCVELSISAFRDPMFGAMVSCSSDGVAEHLGDVVMARAPVSRVVAAEMLGRLHVFRFARDSTGAWDTDPITAFIAKFSQIGAGAPWSRFTLKMNPVNWSRTSVTAGDSQIVLKLD